MCKFGVCLFSSENLFNDGKSGADPEATKALVIITDGSPSDNDNNVIDDCEKLNIARFIIGVSSLMYTPHPSIHPSIILHSALHHSSVHSSSLLLLTDPV